MIKKFFCTIKNLITSPTYLGKLDLNWLICLFIIILELFILIFPVEAILKSDVETFGRNNRYIKCLYEDYDVDNYEEMKALEFEIKDDIAQSVDGIHIFKSYKNERTIHYVFDTNDVANTEIQQIYTGLKENDENMSDAKAQYVAIAAYSDANYAENKNEIINNYLNKDEDELKSIISEQSYYDVYHIEPNESGYIIIFNKESMIVQIPSEDFLSATSFEYTDDFAINNIETFAKFKLLIANQIAIQLIAYEMNNYIIYITLSVILVPLFVALIVYLSSKKSYRPKLSKYVKLSYLLSALPSVIALISALFFKTACLIVYIILAAIYGLIMLFLTRKKMTV